MARIPLYQQSTSVSSVQTGRGSYMGEALKALGNAGVSALERYNQVQDEKQKDLVYTAASKARGEWSAKLAEAYSKAPAGATGVHEQIIQEYNNFVAEQEGQVPEGQRELYKRLMADVGSQLTVVSMENTINARSQQAKQNFETSMNDDMNFIMQSPVAYEGIISQAESRIDSNSLISGDVKNQLKEQVRQKYAKATIQGLVNQGKFSEARKLINDGTLDKYIAADVKARSADFITDAEQIEVNKLITEQRRVKAELEAKDNETLVNIYAQPDSFSPSSLLELRNKGELSDEGYIKAVKELNRATSAKIEGIRNERTLEDLELKGQQEENYKDISVRIEKGEFDDLDSRTELLNRLDKDKWLLGEAQFSKVLNSLKSRGKDTGKSSTEEALYKDVFKNYKDYTPERIASLEGVSSSTRTHLFNIAERLRKKEETAEKEEATTVQNETFNSLNLAIADGQFRDPEARKALYKSIGDGSVPLSSAQINQVIGKLSVKETTEKYTMEETELLTDVMINPKEWSDERIAESMKSGNLSLAAGEKAFAIKNKRLNAMSKDVTTSDYVQLLGKVYKGEYRGKDASAKLWSDLNNNVYNLKPNEAAQILRAVKNSQAMSPFLSQAVSKMNMQAKGILFEQGPFGVIATEDSSQKMYNFSYIVNDTIAKATESGMSEDDIIKTYFDPKSPKYLGNQISYVQDGGSMQGNATGTNNNQLNTTGNESINIGSGSLTFED